MWTPDIVKLRFIEASKIERRMRVKGMTNGGNGWPSYGFTKEEMAGWLEQDIADELEWWATNKATSTPELTRWEEVYFYWTPMIPERRRSLVWRFAQCRASGRSFSKYCEKKGLVRMTAYNRLDRVFETLSNRFLLEGRLMRLPKGTGALLDDQSNLEIDPTIGNRAVESAPRIHPAFISEKPADRLKTPEDMAQFVAHLEDVNDKRRKALLRRLSRNAAAADAA